MPQRNQKDFLALLAAIARALNDAGISYAITGGYAVSVWGRPRSTLDVDVLTALTSNEVAHFARALRHRVSGCYVDEEMAREAIERGGEFNVIDGATGIKIDFWVVHDESARRQLTRRVARMIGGTDVHFLSPEDLIISKLAWHRGTGSTRHMEDVEGIFAVSGDQIDYAYLKEEAARRGVEDLLTHVQKRIQQAAPFSFSYAVAAERGARPIMEDRHVIVDERAEKGRWYCGVYDGHGGAAAAEYAQKHVHEKALKEMDVGYAPENAFRIVYEEMSRGIRDPHVGACAVDCVILRDGALHYAHAGDCRLMVVRENGVIQLTHDHRVTNTEERKRIEESGGSVDGQYVVKGEYGLMPTRSLGDAYFCDAGVTATPETGQYRLKGEDRWIVAVSDGLCDVVDNEEIAALLQRCASVGEAAVRLTQMHAARGGGDNMTAVVIHMVEAGRG